MRGLVLRLAGLSTGAEGAMRLIGFFDTLVEQRLGLDGVLGMAARVAECPVGLAGPGTTGLTARPDGRTRPGGPPAGAAVRELRDGQYAWLARAGAPQPFDALLLERLALACDAVLSRRGGETAPLDPALLETVISSTAPLPERARALRLLGFAPSVPLTLLAVDGGRGPQGLAPVLDRLAPTSVSRSRTAALGSVHAVAVTGPLPERLLAPAGFRIGVGPKVTASEAPRSWEGAVRALRFAGTSRSDVGLAPVVEEPAIYHSSLGAFEVLARELSGPAIADIGDLAVLDALAAEPGSGTELLTTLEVLVQADSLRAAARTLHLHHNSVAVRVARAEAALGYGLGETVGRFRLALALALRRLRDNPA
ncbi:helix-turn-helix domain-containing protein [Streptomyces sp. NPDC088256]|uniref:helix-turn-helix domain-containing protein n=1 Tax=Streptomyces sp. NPDC088256 TaxID=3365848 RepID=UPI003825008B